MVVVGFGEFVGELGAGDVAHAAAVLGGGEVSVALQGSADAYTASAKEKLEAAGGTAE